MESLPVSSARGVPGAPAHLIVVAGQNRPHTPQLLILVAHGRDDFQAASLVATPSKESLLFLAALEQVRQLARRHSRRPFDIEWLQQGIHTAAATRQAHIVAVEPYGAQELPEHDNTDAWAAIHAGINAAVAVAQFRHELDELPTTGDAGLGR